MPQLIELTRTNEKNFVIQVSKYWNTSTSKYKVLPNKLFSTFLKYDIYYWKYSGWKYVSVTLYTRFFLLRNCVIWTDSMNTLFFMQLFDYTINIMFFVICIVMYYVSKFIYSDQFFSLLSLITSDVNTNM